ncbi:MAG: acetylornithine aminotransferase apoenzyme [Pseudonocardiales bacterium]|nr:acetylornithine aminotransferase apoenzyme [Jatrophihabitantaceae bacterium]MCW2602035.1 acetylornithine aminotransferase apoenzyme [Pseudonocardiales bacterium]
MTTTQELTELWNEYMMPNYGTPPIGLASGSGVRVTDVDGKQYLDFIAGIATSSLGHNHPAIVAAVSAQVATIAHTSNLVMQEPALRLAKRLVDLAGGGARVFFSNDGATANEAALKLVRKHALKLDADNPRTEIIAAHGGFHGRTLGALSITGNPAKRLPFAPLVPGATFIPYGDIEALEAAVTERTAAVFLEPALGEGGVVPAPEGYLAAARAACNRVGALFVLDEVQSGIGRTGHWFAFQKDGIRPDVLTLAKGLGGGMPIGAVLAFGDAGTLFAPGDHGSTFGGNPVSSSSALAVLDTIAADGLLASVTRVGEHLATALGALSTTPGGLVSGVRGSGLWRALVLTGPHAGAIEVAARAHGLLVNAVQPDAIRLAPPLIVTEDEVDEAIALLALAIADVAATLAAAAPAGAGA